MGVNVLTLNKYVWQSCVEIEGYSVAYFECIAVFGVSYR